MKSGVALDFDGKLPLNCNKKKGTTMFITTQNEIISLMPTARWDRPQQLFGYLEEEERVALEPLLGTTLYQHLCAEYVRLHKKYSDITSTTVLPTGIAKEDAGLPYADVTERIESIQAGMFRQPTFMNEADTIEVPAEDLATIQLLRICQQIEWYKMLSHNGWLLTISFNEGGGMNIVTADGYEEASTEKIDKAEKEAFMKAGRAIDSLLLFLEADAKGAKLFTEKWSEADAFYLHKDLLFQTARVLNEYLDIKGERMAYVQLVRDIRFCQNTYLKPRVGAKLLKCLTPDPSPKGEGSSDSSNEENIALPDTEVGKELLSLLRTALAFYVESRRTELAPVREKLARRDSMTDAQQAMATACAFIEENLDALGEAVVGTPIYNNVRAREEQEKRDAANVKAAQCRRMREACEQNRRKLFTGFPATHRSPETKN